MPSKSASRSGSGVRSSDMDLFTLYKRAIGLLAAARCRPRTDMPAPGGTADRSATFQGIPYALDPTAICTGICPWCEAAPTSVGGVAGLLLGAARKGESRANEGIEYLHPNTMLVRAARLGRINSCQHPPERQRTFGNVHTDAPAVCRPNLNYGAGAGRVVGTGAGGAIGCSADGRAFGSRLVGGSMLVAEMSQMRTPAASAAAKTIQNADAMSIMDRGGAVCGSS